MSEARLSSWTLREFLAWEERQDAKYEFVDGQPRMMTGVSQAHGVIVVSIGATLRNALRGSPCRISASDLRVITGTGNSRYPDAVVDCGPFRPASHDASEPVALFEVLSRSTAWIDLHHKLRDYDATPAIRQYVVVAQDVARVEAWRRDTSGRLVLEASLTEPEERLTVEPSGAPLSLADIYDGIPFDGPPAP